jgi:hypothetical protein
MGVSGFLAGLAFSLSRPVNPRAVGAGGAESNRHLWLGSQRSAIELRLLKAFNKAAKAEYNRLTALPSVGPNGRNCPVRDLYAMQTTLQRHPAVKLDVGPAG